ILGVSALPLRNATNVARLVEQVQEVARQHQDALGRYVEQLKRRLEEYGAADPDPDRLRTARAAHALAVALATAKRGAVVETLARAEVATSPTAMGVALKQAGALAGALSNARWELLHGDQGLAEPYAARAQAVADKVVEALKHDEHATALAGVLREAEGKMVTLLQEAARAAKDRTRDVGTPTGVAGDARGERKREGGGQHPHVVDPETLPPGVRAMKVRANELDELVARLREETKEAPNAWVRVQWEIVQD